MPLKNKNAHTIKDSFEDILLSSKRSPNLIKSDRGKEFYNTIFQDFLNKSIIKIYSRNTSLGAVFAERLNRTIGDLIKNIVFEQGNAKWIDILPTMTKRYNDRTHSSTKLTPIQTSFKNNDLVRTADLRKRFQKGTQLIGFLIFIKPQKY